MPRKNAKSPKVSKPYADFPLTAHRNGQWCKKIKGKIHYFGPVGDPDAALAKYLEDRDDLQAGRTPKRLSRQPGTLTLRDLCNQFLYAQEQRLKAGEIAERTFQDLNKEATRLLSVLDRQLEVENLTPQDFGRLRFELSKRYGPTTLKLTISRIKRIFAWAYESELIEKPIRFGPDFKPPSAKAIRQQRQQTGKLLFDRKELLALLEAARHPLKAMILLAANCGFGNSDLAELPLSAIDLKSGWINFPRPKTAIDRRCPLWPETIAAVREAIAKRPKPAQPEDDALAFLTQPGEPWVRIRETASGKKTPIDSVGREFGKLLTATGIKRHRLNFYSIRHTFRTIADASRDQPAVDFLMGHAPAANDMRAVYVEDIADERLQAVAAHVRGWLFETNPAL